MITFNINKNFYIKLFFYLSYLYSHTHYPLFTIVTYDVDILYFLEQMIFCKRFNPTFYGTIVRGVVGGTVYSNFHQQDYSNLYRDLGRIRITDNLREFYFELNGIDRIQIRSGSKIFIFQFFRSLRLTPYTYMTPILKRFILHLIQCQ